MGVKEGSTRKRVSDYSRKENGNHHNKLSEAAKLESQRRSPSESVPTPAKRPHVAASSETSLHSDGMSTRSSHPGISFSSLKQHPSQVSAINSGRVHPSHRLNGTNSSSGETEAVNLLQHHHLTSVRAAMLEAEARAEAVAALRSSAPSNPQYNINSTGTRNSAAPVVLTNGRSHAPDQIFSASPSDRLYSTNTSGENEMFARESHRRTSSGPSTATAAVNGNHHNPRHHQLLMSYSASADAAAAHAAAAAAAAALQRSLSEEISRETDEEWKNIHTVSKHCIMRSSY